MTAAATPTLILRTPSGGGTIADNGPPEIVSRVPPADAPNAARTAAIELHFDRPIVLTDPSGCVLRGPAGPVAATVTLADTRLILTPSAPLDPGTAFEVSLAAGAVRADRDFPGTSWRFTTVDDQAPGGYQVAIGRSKIVQTTVEASLPIQVTGAETGARYDWALTGGAVSRSGFGTVPTAGFAFDVPGSLSGFPDGTLVLTLRLTDPGGLVGPDATATVEKDTSGPAAPTLALVRVSDGTTLSGIGAALAPGGAGVAVTAPSGLTANWVLDDSDGATPPRSGGPVTTTGATTMLPLGDVTGLRDGSLTFGLTLRDTDANATLATLTVTKSVTAPTLPGLAVVALADGSALDTVTAATANGGVGLRLTGGVAGTSLSLSTDDTDGATPATLSGPVAVSGNGIFGLGDLRPLRDGTLTVTATVRDAVGNQASGQTTVTKDATGPSVTTVAPPAAQTWYPGQTLTFTLTFSEATRFAWGAQPPRLELTIGGAARAAPLASGQGASATGHNFSYVVAAGDSGAVALPGAAIALPSGATAADAAGNPLTPGFTAPNLAGVTVAAAVGLTGFSGAQRWADGTAAPSCRQYLAGSTGPGRIGVAAGTAANGVYWIAPSGTQIQVYCDMQTDGGGWTLAGHSAVAGTGYSAFTTSNKAMPGLACGGGTYRPTNRSNTNGAINALALAQNATEVAFGLGGTVTTGPITAHSSAFKFSIPSPSALTFSDSGYVNNPNQGACQAVIVQPLPVTGATWTRYTFRNTLSASWGDSFPSGYGATSDMTCRSGHTDGPFITNAYSGSGRNYPSYTGQQHNDCGASKGYYTYTHYGNRSATGNNITGDFSIWFR